MNSILFGHMTKAICDVESFARHAEKNRFVILNTVFGEFLTERSKAPLEEIREWLDQNDPDWGFDFPIYGIRDRICQISLCLRFSNPETAILFRMRYL